MFGSRSINLSCFWPCSFSDSSEVPGPTWLVPTRLLGLSSESRWTSYKSICESSFSHQQSDFLGYTLNPILRYFKRPSIWTEGGEVDDDWRYTIVGARKCQGLPWKNWKDLGVLIALHSCVLRSCMFMFLSTIQKGIRTNMTLKCFNSEIWNGAIFQVGKMDQFNVVQTEYPTKLNFHRF